MALIDELINQYVSTDLGDVFNLVGLTGVDPDNYQALQQATLAQWLLESGRGTSKLAKEGNNFAGLKWRSPDMNGFATPLNIKVPSEPNFVEFCKFDGVEAFIVGYWKFLTRSPYKALADNTDSPAKFIGFLKSKGFAADPNYINKVLDLPLFYNFPRQK